MRSSAGADPEAIFPGSSESETCDDSGKMPAGLAWLRPQRMPCSEVASRRFLWASRSLTIVASPTSRFSMQLGECHFTDGTTRPACREGDGRQFVPDDAGELVYD